MSARTGDLGKTMFQNLYGIRTIEFVGNVSGLAFCQVYEAGLGRAIVVNQAST